MNNPVIQFGGDPFVLKDGDDYYCSTTSPKNLRQRAFPGYHSKDLVNWSSQKVILDFDNVSWANGKAWAPSMAKYNGYYYLAFCADQQIGIAVCEDPMGTYRDIIGKPLVKYEQYGFQTIDPCLFVDDDNKIYLLFGQGKCYFVELDISPDGAQFADEPICLSDDLYYQASLNPSIPEIKTIYNEAPDLIKINGKYLFSWAIYDVRDYRYCTKYAWADKVRGPYIQPIDEDHDNILIKGKGSLQCTGHSCIQEFKGEYYVFYGRYIMPRNDYTRELCMDKITFLDEYHLMAIPSR
jgi:beta-xylosidase